MHRNAFVPATRLFRSLPLAVLLFAGVFGCGGGSTPPAAVGVTIATPSASKVDPGDSLTLTATASSSSSGVTWTLSGSGCSGSGCGVLSGATTAAVTYTAPASPSSGFTATITATSVSDATKSATASLTVVVAPAISTTTGALAGGTVGTAYSLTLVGGGGIAPYTWAVTNGSLPAGLSLGSTTGTISGTPTAAGSPSFTVTLTDSGSPALTSSVAYSIPVASPPAIVFGTPSLPNGTVGAAYNGSVSATGGAGALTYAVNSGALPANLQLNTTNGAITGTPSGAAVSNFTIKATDAYGDNGTSASYSITTAYPALTITTSTLPAGTAGAAYSTTLAASGGSGSGFTWNVTSGGTALSALGLSLSSGGVLSGSNPTYGTAAVTVKVTDSASDTASANFTVTVNYPTLSITTASLPAGIVGGAYSVQLAASGGSGSGYSYTVQSGTGLSAAGLSLSSGGAISGPPTSAETVASVTIKVTDSANNTATQTFSVTVYPALVVTPSTLPNGTVGTAYSQTLGASGGSGSGYSFTVISGTGLSAAGLSLSSSGAITGMPSTVESAGTFTVKVTDGAGDTASLVYSLTVVYPALTVTTSSLPNGSVGVAYSQPLAASGGSGSGYTWTVTVGASSLSAVGLSVSSGGVVSASSPTQGTATFTVNVTDSASNTASASFSVTVYTGLTVTTTTLPSADAGTAYSQPLAAAGGSGSGYSWTVIAGQSSLTATGISVSSSGVVSATSLIAGTASFTVKVTDSASNSATQALTVTVNPALSITTTTLPTGTAGTAYSQTLAAGGGNGSGYTWSVTAGASSLSAVGLSVSSGGVVSASSPTQGTASFTVKVTDSTGASTTQAYSVTIYGALSITTNSLPNGTVGTAYSQAFAASGGTGSGYTWSVTSNQSGLTALGLSLSSGGVLSGSSTTYGTATFGVKVTDSASNTASGSFSVTINYPALSITTSSIATATVNSAYSQSFQASGGSGNYTWSIISGQSGLTGDSLSLSTGGTLSGTPPNSGNLQFTVQVKDTTTNNTASQAYTLTVNAAAATYTVSGTFYSASNCGGTVQGATVSINTSPVITTTTNASGNYTLSGVPAGNWTITPSYTGASAVFFPATQAVSISGATSGQNFGAQVTYTLSGTVSYSGAKTGRVYLAAISTTCSGSGAPGTSISAPGAYTIRGVGAPGTYTVQAFMDTLGYGAANAADPTGVANVTMNYANGTGANVTLTDPATVTLSSAPSLNGVGPLNTGALVLYNALQSNNSEQATSYTVQWSTSSSFATVTGSQSFPAYGTHTNALFLNGLSNGSVLYFRMKGVAGSSSSPYSSIAGPVTIGAPTGGNTVSGTVTFSGTATGPLYVGFYGSTGFYGQYIANPSSPQAFTVQVPSGSYQFVAQLDQNNNGIVDAGDLQNITSTSNGNAGVATTISGSTTGLNLTLASAGGSAAVATQALYAVGNTVAHSYSLNLQASQQVKLPVAVSLASGPNVVVTTDVASCAVSGNNCGQGFQIGLNTYTSSPSVGDTYTFNVTYGDGTTGTLTAQVSAVLSAFATNLSPTTGTSTSTQPTFSWTDPANAGNYGYQFSLSSTSGGTIWQIPGNNSNSNSFSSSITSIPWNTDPTGGGSLPSIGSLSTSTNYVWQINVIDSNNNQAITQVQYQP